jgi:hypothetical protein
METSDAPHDVAFRPPEARAWTEDAPPREGRGTRADFEGPADEKPTNAPGLPIPAATPGFVSDTCFVTRLLTGTRETR